MKKHIVQLLIDIANFFGLFTVINIGLEQKNAKLCKAQSACDDNVVFHREAEVINHQGKDSIKIGRNTHIRGQLMVFTQGGDIEIGDDCYIGRNSYIWSAKKIIIGNRVLISHNCNIFDNNTHPLKPTERYEQFNAIIGKGKFLEYNLETEEIIIEDDVLIGANCTILKGVKIGKGAVVGAGSVVTKDVSENTIVAGNPAKILKEIK
ncbi:MAG: acyltransferase [FCB group bacterium]|jgi:acetyltransferase-like isoleucine patch superfamily enzyme